MHIVTLKSGLRVIFQPIHFYKSASFGIWIPCGAKLETAAENGASHFLEHLLFKGTDHLSAMDIAVQTDLFGGQVNAYTTREYTCLYAHTLSSHVAKGFAMLCDMVTGARLDEDDIRTERGVILDEIAMYDDSAEELAADLLSAGVWEGHPMGRPILGTAESVRGLSADRLRTFRAQHYLPSQMVLSVCGNFDEAELLEIAERYFPVADNRSAPPVVPPLPWQPSVRLREKDFEQTAVTLGFPGLSANDPDRFALSILSSIIGANASSRLFQRLREELGLAYSVYSYSACHTEGGLFGVTLTVTPECEEQALSEAIRILRSAASTITEEEVYRSREQFKAGLVMGLEGISSRCGHAARGILFENAVLSEEELLALIEAVTREDVVRLCERTLCFDRMAVAAAGRVRAEADYASLRTL